MSKIVVIGAGAMGTAFTYPCLDNNHDTNIIGTHLEDDFIDNILNPLDCNDLRAVSLPDPGPFTCTVKVLSPCS